MQSLGHTQEPKEGEEKVTLSLLVWASLADVLMLYLIF